MEFTDGRRTYYDHEKAYRQITAKGGVGWDDLSGAKGDDSYASIHAFLESSFAAHLNADSTVLELGCGGGQVALMFARRGCITHGLDYSPTAVSLARLNADRAGLTVDFREGDCLTLKDYADASFDLVVDNHVWHCIVGREDRAAFLKSAFRVLKPGGLFFSETMTREGGFSPSTVGADPATFVALNQSRYWVAREEALKELESVGFEIVYEDIKSQAGTPGIGDLLVVYGKRP